MLSEVPLRFLVRATYYPTLWFNDLFCALGVWRRWDWVEPNVALGAVPARAHLRALAGQGVRAVVNLCAESGGHTEVLAAEGLTQLHLPTLDYHSPSPDDVQRGVRFIAAQVRAGGKVYVHCKAGRGRAALLVACYLMAAHGWSATQAVAHLRRARSQVDRGLERRPVVLALEEMLVSGQFRCQEGT